MFFGIQHTEFTYPYYVEPNGRSCKAFKNDQCHWPRGKVIGGSGAINAMLFVRGNRFDYDRWSKEGSDGWSYDEIWPYFEKLVRPVGNETHPQGYVMVNEFPHFDEDIGDILFKGSSELGVPTVEEFIEGSYIGYSRIKGTINNGHRASTGKGHLGKVSHRPNLKVIKNAQVTKLIFDSTGKRVEAIEFNLRQKHQLKVNVNREAILSAGTIDTPKVLMLSGVGPQKELDAFNIPVIHDLPIGENLQDHVLIQVYWRLPGNPYDQKQLLDAVYQYLIHNRGPFTAHGPTSITGFINTNFEKNNVYPDIELHHLIIRRGDLLGLDQLIGGFNVKDELKAELLNTVKDYDILVMFAILAHPKSVGNLQLKSNSPQDPPLIKADYLSASEDVEVLLRAMQYLMKLEQTQAFREKQVELLHIPLEECDQYQFKSENYWKCYFSYFSSTCYHHVGTVKMGAANDESACVDSCLKLKGTDNLRVIDASVMPYVTSGNTNAPTAMIAEKASDLIKEYWSASSDSNDKDNIHHEL